MPDGVDIVRQIYAAFQSGDYKAAFDFYDRDIEWDVSASDLADVPRFHGHEGVREFWRRWLGVWRGYQVDVESAVQLGDFVIADVRVTAIARASGMEIENRHAQVWTIRNGKVIRMQFFQDRAAARKALGLANGRQARA